MTLFAGSRDFTIQNSVFHSHNSGPKGGFDILQKYVADGAFHNSKERFDAPKCHPNTRVAIIKKITDWINGLNEDTREAFIMWLYGAAGAGKSAISQSIAGILDAEHFILATFFFKRDHPQRGTAEFLVTTLAYQLAVKLPMEFRGHLALVFEKDPLIMTRSIETQFNALIREPLVELVQSGFSASNDIVLIIDGLDECKDSNIQVQVIDASFSLLQSWDIPLKIVIASRPELDIYNAFGLKPSLILARLALDNDYQSKEDIHRFLVDKFKETKSQHCRRTQIPTTWPSKDAIRTIVEKSSGQFIYASTVVKYIASPRHIPMDRLKTVLGIQPPKSGENPFAELDALYHYILSGFPSEDSDLMMKILRFVVFSQSLDLFLTGLDSLFSSSPGDVQLLLQDLGSLVKIGNQGLVFLLHASLKDYLHDKSRSKNLFLDPSKIHTHYSELCITRIMDLKSSTTARCARRPLNSSVDMPQSFWFLFETFFYHCPRANSSELLVDTVLNLSLDHCHTMAAAFDYNTMFVSQYFDYLDCVSKNWADARISQLYSNEIAAFKQIMKSCVCPHIQYLPACFLLASLLHGDLFTFAGAPLIPTYPKSENPDRFFKLGDAFASLENLKLRQSIQDTLHDSIISSYNPADISSISASAAFFVLRYLSTWKRPHGTTISRFGRSCRYLRTRTNSPAQSRWYRQSINMRHTMYGKGDNFRQFFRSAKKVFVDANFCPGWNGRQFLHSRYRAYFSALIKLPGFLNKSGYSAELVSLANHARIKPHDKHYIENWLFSGVESYRATARAAVKAYLKRVADVGT